MSIKWPIDLPVPIFYWILSFSLIVTFEIAYFISRIQILLIIKYITSYNCFYFHQNAQCVVNYYPVRHCASKCMIIIMAILLLDTCGKYGDLKGTCKLLKRTVWWTYKETSPACLREITTRTYLGYREFSHLYVTHIILDVYWDKSFILLCS